MTNVSQTVYTCLSHTEELALLTSFFKWANSSAPDGYFWLVLGASWSRIWNKWFPTKKWIEKGSDCEGSLNNIWENAHWLASFTWNREYFFFFSLWQKVWLKFLYWGVAYYSIQIFKFSTKLTNRRDVGWKGPLAVSYSNLLSETGLKPTLNWVSRGFVQPSLANLRGRRVEGLSEQPQVGTVAITHRI